MIPVVLLPLCAAGFVAFWCVILHMLSAMAGWRTLADLYPAPHAPREPRSFVGIASVGAVRYKGDLLAAVTQDGLYLSAHTLFRPGHAPLLISWTAMQSLPAENILWATEYRFAIRSGDKTTALSLQDAALAGAITARIAPGGNLSM